MRLRGFLIDAGCLVLGAALGYVALALAWKLP